MGVHDRVVTVVMAWAKLDAQPADADQLQVIWAGSTARHDYPWPDAEQRLVEQLITEFRNSPKRKILIKPSDISPPGKIKNIDDLTIAVNQSEIPRD